MTNRIIELASIATLIDPHATAADQQLRAIDFAKLIVKECLLLCDQVADHYATTTDPIELRSNHERIAACNEVRYRLKKQFAVNE